MDPADCLITPFPSVALHARLRIYYNAAVRTFEEKGRSGDHTSAGRITLLATLTSDGKRSAFLVRSGRKHLRLGSNVRNHPSNPPRPSTPPPPEQQPNQPRFPRDWPSPHLAQFPWPARACSGEKGRGCRGSSSTPVADTFRKENDPAARCEETRRGGGGAGGREGKGYFLRFYARLGRKQGGGVKYMPSSLLVVKTGLQANHSAETNRRGFFSW